MRRMHVLFKSAGRAYYGNQRKGAPIGILRESYRHPAIACFPGVGNGNVSRRSSGFCFPVGNPYRESCRYSSSSYRYPTITCFPVVGNGKAFRRSSGLCFPVANPYRESCRYSSSSSSSYFRNLYPLHQQSSPLPGPERIRQARENKYQFKPHQSFPDASTVYEAFLRGKRESRNGPYLGKRPGPERPYEWMTYEEVEEKARLLGSGLLSLREKPGSDTRIGIYSKNRPEWVITDLACTSYSMVTVPLYDNVPGDTCLHIINQTELQTVICDTTSKVEILSDLADQLPSLKNVILMDCPTGGMGELKIMMEARGIRIIPYDDVIQLGVTHLAEPMLPKPESLYTIVYSSGTTGLPKGVMATHRNLVAAQAITMSTFDEHRMTSDDTHCSYLPLSHIFERVNMVAFMIHGGRVGFYRGDPLTLLDDLQALRPTFFVGVPKVYNSIYQRIQTTLAAANPIKRAAFKLAYNRKLALIKRGVMQKDTIWDRLVFKKIQDLFGGRVNMILVGGAPISPDVVQFFKVALPLDCQLIEGYGQTEVSGCVCHAVPHDVTFGHVGVPCGDSQVKLVDVPELGYSADVDEGEVCVKGSMVFQGYYNDPTKTREAFDEDGWFHTGDIGRWNQNGTLQIIDRKGSIFKLSNGKFIAPERVEMVYGQHPVIDQAFVYGDGLKDFIVGIFSTNRDELQKFAARHGIVGAYKYLCEDETLKMHLLNNLQKFGAKHGLLNFEQIKKVHLVASQFSDQEGLVTPTLKIRRKKIAEAYKAQIDAMYQDGDHQSERDLKHAESTGAIGSSFTVYSRLPNKHGT